MNWKVKGNHIKFLFSTFLLTIFNFKPKSKIDIIYKINHRFQFFFIFLGFSKAFFIFLISPGTFLNSESIAVLVLATDALEAEKQYSQNLAFSMTKLLH